MRVVICDPGVGNVRSVLRAIERASESVGAGAGAWSVTVTREPSVVRGADYVVVPGQGAFGAFAAGIASGLADALREHIDRARPYLGICLGMQVLFDSSEEAPGAAGLGVLRGHVRRLAPGMDPATSRPYPLPHIGWSAVEAPRDASEAPTAGEAAARPAPYFYFAHTFACVPEDPTVVAATTAYGEDTFASIVERGRVMGVQFHPEKSQREGLALLARFFAPARGL